MRPPSPLALFARSWLILGLSLWLAATSFVAAQTVFINEIHYDNTGNDSGEGVEIAGPTGTNLADYTLVFYNGTNAPSAAPLSSLGTVNLTGTIGNLGAGYGVVWFAIAGIENGPNDAVALYKKSTAQVVQFLSWEGTTANPTVTAAPGAGAAAGLTSVNLSVSEPTSAALNTSLQLSGTGASYPDFTWAPSATATPGALNNGQTLGSVVYSSFLSLNILAVDETAGASTVTGTVTLSPPPTTARTISLTSSEIGRAHV